MFEVVVEIVTIEKSELEEIIQRAAKFGATLALEEIQHDSTPELMTKQELSDYLRCDISKINRLMKKDLPFEQFGDTPRFRKSKIDNWLEKK